MTSTDRPDDRETLTPNWCADELERMRERRSSHPHDIAMLERRLADARTDARTTAANNERLAATLREARDQIVSLKSEVDRLAQPPASFGVFVAEARGAHRRHLHLGPQDAGQRQPRRRHRGHEPGQELIINEALNVVDVLEFDDVGEVVLLKEVLEDGDRALVIGHGDEEQRGPAGRPAARPEAPVRGLAADRPAGALRVRADPQAGRRGTGAGRGAGHRLLGDRRPRAPRSRPSATPSSCRSCTRTCSPSTSSRPRRGSCSTARPAAARP